jgi:hypothetical protein
VHVLVRVHVSCDEGTYVDRLATSGWITADDETRWTGAVRGQRDEGTEWDFAVSAGTVLDARVIAEGWVLAGGTEVRLVLHWTAADEALDLAAGTTTVHVAS